MVSPTILQFGAGAIGRGFVGQLWTEAGYKAVFVDVSQELIAALNARRSYPLRLASFDGDVRDIEITPVSAVDVREGSAVSQELAHCTLACTAVGVNVFGLLAPTFAKGVEARFRSGNAEPLNIICCENQVNAGKLLRNAVSALLPPSAELEAFFENRVAFVDASVGRMVPPPTPTLLAEDPLLLLAEPFGALPVDAAAWIGPDPEIPGLHLKQNFAGYVARKLFTHNGGHAALAYHGFQAGLTYIWEAAGDKRIRERLEGFWIESGRALVAAFGFDALDQLRHQEDLLQRFSNRALDDTTQRVARDPLRKLRPDDRLVGAALLCIAQDPDTTPLHICRTIAAALRYADPSDPSAVRLQARIAGEGLRSVLTSVCGISFESPLRKSVLTAYENTSV